MPLIPNSSCHVNSVLQSFVPDIQYVVDIILQSLRAEIIMMKCIWNIMHIDNTVFTSKHLFFQLVLMLQFPKIAHSGSTPKFYE